MICPQCKSRQVILYGKARNRQRYQCKVCGCQFVEQNAKVELEQMQKRHALILFLHACSYRNIASYVDSTHVSVSRWAKSWKPVVELRKKTEIETVEKEYMIQFIEAKKNIRNYKLMLIDLETGVAVISSYKQA